MGFETMHQHSGVSAQDDESILGHKFQSLEGNVPFVRKDSLDFLSN